MAIESAPATNPDEFTVVAVIPSANAAQLLFEDGALPSEVHADGPGTRTYEDTLADIGHRLIGSALSVDRAFYRGKDLMYLTKAVDPKDIRVTNPNVTWWGPGIETPTSDSLQQYWRTFIGDLIEAQSRIRFMNK